MGQASGSAKQLNKAKPLKFGTSGLRALVSEMTDLECTINTRGFVLFLEAIGDISFLIWALERVGAKDCVADLTAKYQISLPWL